MFDEKITAVKDSEKRMIYVCFIKNPKIFEEHDVILEATAVLPLFF